MVDGPKRHKTDPYLRLDAEEIRRLELEGHPSPTVAEAMISAYLGPQDEPPGETMVPCPTCTEGDKSIGRGMVAPRVVSAIEKMRLKAETFDAALADAIPPLESDELDEDEETQG